MTKPKTIKDIDATLATLLGDEPAKEGCSPAPYSTDWAFGGPLIEKYEIDVKVVEEGRWRATMVFPDLERHHRYGPTPLVAAMRCLVAHLPGDTDDDEYDVLIYPTATLPASKQVPVGRFKAKPFSYAGMDYYRFEGKTYAGYRCLVSGEARVFLDHTV